MRALILSMLALPAAAQEYVEPEWLPPLPPEYEAFCGNEERTSEPIVSYRVAPDCTITDIHAVGEYQYGTEQVRADVRGLSTSDTIRRFTGGSFIHYREVRIMLHRAMEEPRTLICTTAMMGGEVIDAKIARQPRPGESSLLTYEQSVPLEDKRLPDLGVFTYTRPVTYTLDNCPE